MTRMEVRIVAGCQGDGRKQRADLELPAGPYEILDALQRAHVPGCGEYGIEGTGDWPDFLEETLWGAGPLFGKKALEELNFLADIVGHMDGMQIMGYEGAIWLYRKEKRKRVVTPKELINLAFCLDDYEFQPGVTDVRILGERCMEGGMLELLDNLPDSVAGLIDPVKVGMLVCDGDHGVFTRRGYVYRSADHCHEIYDGEHLPPCGDCHSGIFSLRIEKQDAPDGNSGVWLEMPADGKALQRALLSIGEESFSSCRIAEIKGMIPDFPQQLEGDGDMEKLNILAGRLQGLLQELPGGLMIAKYKAALQLERRWSLDLALDIAANMDCYVYSPDILSPDAFGEYVLQSAGIDTDDPAFRCFDFDVYGRNQLKKAGYVPTLYGAISRSGLDFVHEYTKQAQELAGFAGLSIVQ